MTETRVEWNALLSRVTKIEMQNRRLKIAWLVAVSVLGAAFLLGQAAPKGKAMEAEEFLLKDAKGKTRASLALSPDGSVSFDLNDTDGKLRAKLGIVKNVSPRLELLNDEGKTEVVLSTRESKATRIVHGEKKTEDLDSSGLNLYDGEGKLRAVLGVGGMGAPYFSIRDEHGRKLWGYPPVKEESAKGSK